MKILSKNIGTVFLTAAACFLLLAGSAFAQGKLSVRIAAETTIQFDQVQLGEIATVTGADLKAVEKVKGISLGFSPRTGMMREISRANILLAIAAAGFDKTVALEMSDKVLVRRAAQVVDFGALRQAVESAILPQFAADNVTAKITKLELPERVDLPTGSVEVRVINFQGITHFNEPTIMSLEIRVEGKVLRRMPANVTVEASAEVLVLTKDLTPGTRIAAGDVQIKTIALEKPVARYVRDAAQINGKKTLKNLGVGAPLMTDAITADAVIKYGDAVSIVAMSGKMKFAVAGKARASGRIGDRIAVKNTQSGVIIQAVVVDEGTVKLNF